MWIFVTILFVWAIVAETRAYKNMKIANANKSSAEAWLATTLLHIKAEKAAKSYLEIIGDTVDTQQTQINLLVYELAKACGYTGQKDDGDFQYLLNNYAQRLKISQAAILEARKQVQGNNS